MPLETTAENLNILVAEIIKDGADVSGLLVGFDTKNNSDPTSLHQEKLFDDVEKSVNKFREELFGKKAIRGNILGGIQNFDFTQMTGSYAINPSPLEIKKKVGFEKDKPNPWLKTVDSTKLTKKEAQKFFYQRLLLSSFKDEDIFVTNTVFHDDVHPTENVNQNQGTVYHGEHLVEVEKDTIADLWLYAKFNELKEKEKIPENYEYKPFVGLVRKSIEAAAKKGSVEKVNTQTILDAVKARSDLERDAATKIQRIFRANIGTKEDENYFKKKGSEFINKENISHKINDVIVIKDGQGKDTGLKNIKLLRQILEKRKDRKAKISGLGDPGNNASGGVVADEIRKMQKQLQKLLDGTKSSDPTRGEWQADGTRNVTYQYLRDNNYVSNGENHYLIPEIRGREPGAVTQYATGLPVFNYKDLNEFYEDAAEAGKGEWDKNYERLLSSIACIGEGENKKYCVVTSSARGVTKAFISQTEFNEITVNAAPFYDFGLESAIKTTALDETLEVLNSAKKRFEVFPSKELEIINNEIAAIEVRKTYMRNVMTNYSNFTVDERLSFLDLYNNLDIALPEGIVFTKEEKTRFEAAKSRTVVVDNSYNTALEVVLKMDAAYEIALTLEEAKTEHENEREDLLERKIKLAVGEDATEIEGKIAAAELAIDTLTKFIETNFNKEKLFDKASFLYQKDWSLTTVLEDLDDLYNSHFLSKNKIDEIREFADRAIDRSKDKPQDIAEKLTLADVRQIDSAQNLADKEFGIKTLNRKEKLEKALDKEKESARHSASCSYSHEMAKTVERSIENEVINGLDTFEVTSMAEDMVNKHASKGTIFYQSEKVKEEYAKAVRKTCKAPVPHTNVNGVGFHRPRGTSIVSVGFSYNGVGREGELTGNTEAYVHIDGSNQCYIGCRVCPKDGMNMSVWIDGKPDAKKEYKRGDTAINQNTISFLDPKTQIYTHVEASPSALKAHLELMKKNGNSYSGSVETIMAQYEKMQIKVTSQVNNNTLAEEPDIERKVSIMHKGKTLSYNADTPKTTIGKKKVVTEAFDIDLAGEIVVLKPGFSIDSDSKVEDGQHQFVKMNIIKIPGGQDITPYVKLSTNKDGKVIHESEPYVTLEDQNGKIEFNKLTSDDIAEALLSSTSNVDEDDIKDEATKLFGRTVNDFRNIKLVLPHGIAGDAKGKKYEISTPTDFAGVGRGITGNEPSSSLLLKETKSKAIKVNNLSHVHESWIEKRFNSEILVR